MPTSVLHQCQHQYRVFVSFYLSPSSPFIRVKPIPPVFLTFARLSVLSVEGKRGKEGKEKKDPVANSSKLIGILTMNE
jgi:hypothetical protein